MGTILQDIRHARRGLLRSPAYTLTVIATIALGMGATIGVLSVVHSVLLRPLPYRDPGRLVVVTGEMRKRNASDVPFSQPDFLDLRNGAKRMFDGFAAVSTNRIRLTRRDGTAEEVYAASVTPNFFQLLGGKLVLGREFTAADAQAQPPRGGALPDAEAVEKSASFVILSYDYWRQHYGGSASVIGQNLSSSTGSGPEIIGILAPGFELLFPPRLGVTRNPDVWFVEHPSYDNAQRNLLSETVVARLKDDVSLTNAQAEAGVVAADLRKNIPLRETSGFQIDLQPMHEYVVAELRPYILTLMGAAAFLLLVACANVANLLLVRMSLRERELAVRTALGGRRWLLVRQVLAEVLLLAAAGTILGSVLAVAGLHIFVTMAPSNQSLLREVRMDPFVLAAAIPIGLAVAAIFGAGPAIHASRPNVMTVLRTSGRNALLGGGRRLRNGVTIVEIALSFSLLVGAGLMLRSFIILQNMNAGFDPHGVLTFEVFGPQLPNPEQRKAYIQEIRDRLAGIPGVENVAVASPFPLADQFGPIRWGTDQALADPSKFQAADFQIVSPGYFETLRTPLIAGRTFTEADNSPARNLVVIDQMLAAKAFPQESAVGKRILIRIRTPEPEWVEVIGVVAHQRDASLTEAGREEIYFTDGFLGYGAANRWAIRTRRAPSAYEGAVRDAVASLGNGLVVEGMHPMDFFVTQAQATTRLAFLLISVFAAIAAFLAALGIYGVLSTSVRQRTPEIGVRMALGATRASIFTLLVGQGLKLGGLGILIGLGLACFLTRGVSSLLIGVKATDPLIFSSITAGFSLVAGLASWLPARRAAGLEPTTALRDE